MRVGVVILPQFTAAETARRWKSLQDRGFANGWTYDHLAWRQLADEPWYSTITTLTIAAAATSTLEVGTWVASPNFREPVTFAKDLMSLDDISDGRLVAAVGAGGLGWDAAVLGRPELLPGQRVDRLTEFVALTDLLLRQADTTWHGEYFSAVRARMHPSGARERIALVVAGNGPRSVRLAAGYDGWATIGPQGVEEPEPWWAGLSDLVRRYETERETRGRPGGRRFLDLDSVPGFSMDDADAVARAADRAAGLGFTDAIVQWPRERDVYVGREESLDQLATRVRDGHWNP